MKSMGAIGLGVLGLLLTLALRGTHNETYSAQLRSARLAGINSSSPRQSDRIKQTPSPTSMLNHSLLAEIESETDPDRRSKTLERIVESVSDAALSGVLDSLVTLNTTEAADLRSALVLRWVEKNAPAAAAWAAKISGEPARREALEQIAILWANTDLAKTTAWLRTLVVDESQKTATLGAAYEAARSEPLTALELACGLPATSERDNLLVHAINQWAIADPTAAAGWARTIPDFELQTRLLAAVAVASAEQTPAASAALIANSVKPGESQDRAAVAIVQRWTQSAPREAAAWVAQFPDIPSREAAVQNLVTLWTAQSPEDAADWLSEMPDGPLRDIGVSAHTQALAQMLKTPTGE